MKKAGYVAFAPLQFGELAGATCSTDQIDDTLGKIKIRWVETAHFKIGSALDGWPIPATDVKLRKKLEGELERLKKKLPAVNVKTRMLDPWLRLHLFAQRCEETYEDMAKRLQVNEESFPKQKATLVNNVYMGEGIYLGQPDKYTVLMFKKSSDYLRYLSTFVGRTQEFAQRWNFKVVGSIFIGTAEELENRSHDTAMHVHIVWNIVHNMIDGYRFYSYDLPVWFKEGMAHWYGRRIDPKWDNFDQNESSAADMLNEERWDLKTRQSLIAGRLRPVAEVLPLRDYGDLTKWDHLKVWSMCDYLMSLGDEKWRDFMNGIKGQTDPTTGLAVGKEIVDVQRKALQKVYDVNPLTFEEKWKEWVLRTYPEK
jgi:hypothetical protein